MDTPDEDSIRQYHHLSILFKTVDHFFKGFGNLFGHVSDPRNPKLITYPLPSLLFTGILMYLCRLGTRRSIADLLRDSVRSRSKYHTLFDVDNVPHGDTLNYCFKRLATSDIQESVCKMVEMLLRGKVLYAYRLLARYFMVAIDGTGVVTFNERHCDHCLTRKLNNGSILYYHPVLEAKLVTANGFCFSVMTEFIENADLTADKQDCELKAFYRLASRLKARFPRLPICLLLDGLYAGGPTFAICEAYNWKYMITLKDDHLCLLNNEFDALCKLNCDNRTHLKTLQGKETIKQTFRWANELYHQDSNNHVHHLNILECRQKVKNHLGAVTFTKFKWITNFKLNSERAITLTNNGGRKRWKIENEGFNTQKNGGFELEHPYSENENARKIFYLLLQIAHTIFQLIEKGSLFKKTFPKGLGSEYNAAKALLEAWRNLRLIPQAFATLAEGKFQIRFDTS